MTIILMIFSILLMTVGWITYRRRPRTAFRRLLRYAAVVLGSLTLLGAWAYFDLKEGFAVKTSASAAVDDVSFLRLPAGASQIGYWRDGINYLAEFNVSEEEFKESFRKFQFRDIIEPMVVVPKKFGDTKIFPSDSDLRAVVITNGLRYHERWDSGGGYTIVYDRLRSRAYYDFAKR